MLITVRVREHVYNLRSKRCFRRIRTAFGAGCDRHGFRLTHYSVQANHMHLLAEARGKVSLARGMPGLSIRIARSLNRLMARKGCVFADRYHARILRSPREVRHALGYVLCNARKHRVVDDRVRPDWVDPFSTAPWFDGWKCRVWFDEAIARVGFEDARVRAPRTWLLRVGWRRGGPLDPRLTPRA